MECETGIEVGKMAYGTGEIPFIRTSDIVNWGLKFDPKQGVSEEIYRDEKQDVKENDILLVRDGTYLVGSRLSFDKERNEDSLLRRALQNSFFKSRGTKSVPSARTSQHAYSKATDEGKTIHKRRD